MPQIVASDQGLHCLLLLQIPDCLVLEIVILCPLQQYHSSIREADNDVSPLSQSRS